MYSTSQDSVPRKHRLQMNDKEISIVERTAHAIKSWRFADHLLDRAAEKNLSERGILDAIALGKVIEARPDSRIVMRHNGYCTVVNLRKRLVVTCWPNADDDDHATLDLSQYQWKGDAVQAVTNVH